MSEIELKFSLDANRAKAIDAALRRLDSKRSTIESRYFDTGDRRLAEAGLSLRVRRIGRAWEQTLKTPGGNAAEREEETVRRPGRWAEEGPEPLPGLHGGTAAGASLERLLAEGDPAHAVLLPAFESVIARRTVEIETAGARVEVAFDQGVIRAGERSIEVCEVEYELKAGDARALLAFARAGVVDHGMWWNPLSKAARGDRLVRGVDVGPAARARASGVDRTMPGAALLGAVMKSCFDQALANAGEIGAGHRDEELIHQLRVALRRMRTASRELGALVGSLDRGWELAVGRAFRALGEYRDRETVAASIQARLLEVGSPQPGLSTARADPPDPVAIVRDAEFQCALLDVFALTLKSPTGHDAVSGVAVKEVDAEEAGRRIGARLDALRRQIKRSAKRFDKLDPDAQHRVRKRVKGMRYLAELVAPLYKARAAERYLAKLRPAQEALGAYVDLYVALKMAGDAVRGGDAASWFNVGWLRAQLPAGALQCREALRIAAQARAFW